MTQDQSGMPSDGAVAAPPAIVVHGEATPEQVAAVVAVLTAASGGQPDAIPADSSLWADHQRGVRISPTHGQGAWRASVLPR